MAKDINLSESCGEVDNHHRSQRYPRLSKELRKNWPTLAPILFREPRFWPLLAEFGQVWSNVGRVRPKLAKLGEMSAELGQLWSFWGARPNLVKLDQRWPKHTAIYWPPRMVARVGNSPEYSPSSSSPHCPLLATPINVHVLRQATCNLLHLVPTLCGSPHVHTAKLK